MKSSARVTFPIRAVQSVGVTNSPCILKSAPHTHVPFCCHCSSAMCCDWAQERTRSCPREIVVYDTEISLHGHINDCIVVQIQQSRVGNLRTSLPKLVRPNMLPFKGFKHVRWLKLPLANLGKRDGFTKLPTDEKTGQAMPYKDIDSEDGMLSNHQTQPKLDRRTTSTSRIHSYSFLGHFVLVCTYTVVFFVLASRGRWFHDVRKDIVHCKCREPSVPYSIR